MVDDEATTASEKGGGPAVKVSFVKQTTTFVKNHEVLVLWAMLMTGVIVMKSMAEDEDYFPQIPGETKILSDGMTSALCECLPSNDDASMEGLPLCSARAPLEGQAWCYTSQLCPGAIESSADHPEEDAGRWWKLCSEEQQSAMPLLPVGALAKIYLAFNPEFNPIREKLHELPAINIADIARDYQEEILSHLSMLVEVLIFSIPRYDDGYGFPDEYYTQLNELSGTFSSSEDEPAEWGMDQFKVRMIFQTYEYVLAATSLYENTAVEGTVPPLVPIVTSLPGMQLNELQNHIEWNGLSPNEITQTLVHSLYTILAQLAPHIKEERAYEGTSSRPSILARLKSSLDLTTVATLLVMMLGAVPIIKTRLKKAVEKYNKTKAAAKTKEKRRKAANKTDQERGHRRKPKAVASKQPAAPQQRRQASSTSGESLAADPANDSSSKSPLKTQRTSSTGGSSGKKARRKMRKAVAEGRPARPQGLSTSPAPINLDTLIEDWDPESESWVQKTIAQKLLDDHNGTDSTRKKPNQKLAGVLSSKRQQQQQRGPSIAAAAEPDASFSSSESSSVDGSSLDDGDRAAATLTQGGSKAAPKRVQQPRSPQNDGSTGAKAKREPAPAPSAAAKQPPPQRVLVAESHLTAVPQAAAKIAAAAGTKQTAPPTPTATALAAAGANADAPVFKLANPALEGSSAKPSADGDSGGGAATDWSADSLGGGKLERKRRGQNNGKRGGRSGSSGGGAGGNVPGTDSRGSSIDGDHAAAGECATPPAALAGQELLLQQQMQQGQPMMPSMQDMAGSSLPLPMASVGDMMGPLPPHMGDHMAGGMVPMVDPVTGMVAMMHNPNANFGGHVMPQQMIMLDPNGVPVQMQQPPPMMWPQQVPHSAAGGMPFGMGPPGSMGNTMDGFIGDPKLGGNGGNGSPVPLEMQGGGQPMFFNADGQPVMPGPQHLYQVFPGQMGPPMPGQQMPPHMQLPPHGPGHMSGNFM